MYPPLLTSVARAAVLHELQCSRSASYRPPSFSRLGTIGGNYHRQSNAADKAGKRKQSDRPARSEGYSRIRPKCEAGHHQCSQINKTNATMPSSVYLLFDERMGLHRPLTTQSALEERPERVFAVFKRLVEVERRLTSSLCPVSVDTAFSPFFNRRLIPLSM